MAKYKVVHIDPNELEHPVGRKEGYVSLDNAVNGCVRVAGEPVELVNLQDGVWTTIPIEDVGRFRIQEVESEA